MSGLGRVASLLQLQLHAEWQLCVIYMVRRLCNLYVN